MLFVLVIATLVSLEPLGELLVELGFRLLVAAVGGGVGGGGVASRKVALRRYT